MTTLLYRGFIDDSHIVAKVIRNKLYKCKAEIKCVNPKEYTNEDFNAPMDILQNWTYERNNDSVTSETYFTSPLIICTVKGKQIFSLLWNLHVHSKNTDRFVSGQCYPS